MQVYTRIMEMPCYCTQLRQATRRLSAVYDDALAPLGINVAQYALLRRIHRNEPVSLTRLGSLCDLDRSTVGRNVRVLERLELAISTRGSEDQREAMIQLSEGGRDLLQQAVPVWEATQQAVAARLGPQRVEALEDLIAAI
ncbi:DNA-binding MarR family transcriptional regulator [Angulomicrobium tetraedrale]|uniref:DNA-binding MarR family transcriptional regulator n=1 Tax=Ancylobacter tetraedralis TaxID=217068 RepID=A0A839YZN4_9HYPH|nr:MarR family transcriptional regulator [Ancylobacter tetraedralis]MBB3769974.1 DNA-binding MarR family transcriptional regulator [Ancylobacter tetraedralis]